MDILIRDSLCIYCIFIAQTDTFSVEAVRLGSIKSLLIGQDREGSGAGWFLEKVLVKEGGTSDVKLVFPCNK